MMHTPTPWKMETVATSIGSCHKIGSFPSNGVHDRTYACVYADNVRPGEEEHSATGTELLANARFIVRAVNSHDALVTFAEQWIEDEETRPPGARHKALLAMARAALTQAETA